MLEEVRCHNTPGTFGVISPLHSLAPRFGQFSMGVIAVHATYSCRFLDVADLAVLCMFPTVAHGVRTVCNLLLQQSPTPRTLRDVGHSCCGGWVFDGLRSDPRVDLFGRIGHPDPGTGTDGDLRRVLGTGGR